MPAAHSHRMFILTVLDSVNVDISYIGKYTEGYVEMNSGEKTLSDANAPCHSLWEDEGYEPPGRNQYKYFTTLEVVIERKSGIYDMSSSRL